MFNYYLQLGLISLKRNPVLTALMILGIALGIAATMTSLTLLHVSEAKLLPWGYLPVGFVVLWLLGQLAVLGPATRASRVSPAIATRSV